MTFENLELPHDPILLLCSEYDFFKKNRGKSKFCGIYFILCLVTGKYYWGSSIDIKERARAHFWALRENQHANNLLQNAYNLYGEENFQFYLANSMDLSSTSEDLFKMEQHYFDLPKPFASTGEGYNICEIAGVCYIFKPREIPLKLKDPEGIIHEFTCSINEFCRTHNLQRSKISQVLSGKRNHTGGWTLPETNLIKRSYKLCSPNNEVFEFSSISEFARKNNLCPVCVGYVLNEKISHHKSWKLIDTKLDCYQIYDPDDNFYEFLEAKTFAEELKLNYNSFVRFITGHQKLFEGWRTPEMKKYEEDNPQIFISPKGKEFYVTNIGKFAQQNNLASNNLHVLLRGKIKSFQGWKIKKSQNNEIVV